MRFKLPFSKVSNIVLLDSDDIDLPDNIVFAQGETRIDRRNHAADILRNQAEVNAVIMRDPKRDDLSAAMREMYGVADGMRLRADHKLFDHTNTNSAYDTLRDYVRRRNMSMGNPLSEGMDDDLLQQAGKIWEKTCAEADAIKNTFMRQSISTYVPEYSGHRLQEGSHINTHIDSMKAASDFRIVECLAGSGTLVFDDNDFSTIGNNGIALLNDNLTCWELAEGSSVAIRIPSQITDYMGAKATVHAHGIGQPDDTPEERWTVRHDFVFE